MKIEIYNSYCKVIEATEYEKNTLSNKLAYEDTNTKYLKIKNPKLFRFDTRKKLFNKKTKKFPTGLLPFVRTLFEEDEIQLIDKRKKVNKYLYLNPLFPLDELRYYQKEALEITDKFDRGCLEMATGVGKTRLAIDLIMRKGVNTLFVTPGRDISKQTLTIFQNIFGKKYVGTHKDTKIKQITIANYQGLAKLGREFFNNFDMLISDEAHHDSAKSILDLNYNKWNNIYHRYFFTATAYRNDGSDLALKGVIGDIIYNYPVKKAIRDKFLVPPYFYIYKINHPKKIYESYSEEYTKCIVENEPRNKFISMIVNKFILIDESKILVLLERIEHGNILHSMIPDSHWIHGGTKDNHKVIERFNRGDIRVLIASTVIGEGVDLPSVNVLLLAGCGKAKSMIFQKIGRVLRISKNKNKAIIVDFDDSNTHWLTKHTKQRKSYYKKFIIPEIDNYIKEID